MATSVGMLEEPVTSTSGFGSPSVALRKVIDPSLVFSLQVVGPMSNSPAVLYGDYSPTINETLTVTPLNSLGQLSDVVYSADGCSNPRCTTYDSDSVFAAVSKAEVTFVCLGTSEFWLF